jgi:hypothetical protein
MDVLILRDLRPLLLPGLPFAERWGTYEGPGDYNTAVLALTANSSLSSYFLRTGARLELNFHPRILGDIAHKDGRHKELLMLESAVFDPVWTEFDGARAGKCTVPCFRKFEDLFKANIIDEWESFELRNSLDNQRSLQAFHGSTKSPPQGRTLDKFFRGAFAYHIHNLVRSTLLVLDSILT